MIKLMKRRSLAQRDQAAAKRPFAKPATLQVREISPLLLPPTKLATLTLLSSLASTVMSRTPRRRR
jgi:hypothetical protein